MRPARGRSGERRIQALRLDGHDPAGEPQRPVAQQRPGHEPGLGQDLETVADPKDVAAGGRELGDAAHHRGETGDDPGPDVVAVGEASRQDDGRHALQVGRLVPEGDRIDARDGQRVQRVHVRVRAREGDDPDLHASVAFVESVDEVASSSSIA